SGPASGCWFPASAWPRLRRIQYSPFTCPTSYCTHWYRYSGFPAGTTGRLAPLMVIPRITPALAPLGRIAAQAFPGVARFRSTRLVTVARTAPLGFGVQLGMAKVLVFPSTPD